MYVYEPAVESDAKSGADEGDDGRFFDRALLIAAFGALAFLLANIVLYRYGRDQGIYAIVAEAMVTGGAPYKDAWDFKPPGVFIVYALARVLFGKGEHAIRVLEVTALASMVWAFCILSRRWVSDWRAGLLGGVIAIGVHAQLEFWHTAQPESFGAVLIAWGLVCVTYEPREGATHAWRRQLGAWAGAGALYTFAALCKPPLGGAFVVSLGVVAIARVRAAGAGEKLRALVHPALAFSAGGAAVVALVALYFAAKGALADLHYTLFVFTPYYTKLSFDKRWLWAYVYLAFEQFLVGFSSWIAAGLLSAIALPELSTKERGAWGHVLAIVGMQLFGVGLQAKFFPYHYGAALPLGALIAGWGFWKIWLRCRRTVLGAAAFAVFGYVVSQGRGASRDLDDTYWDRCKMRIAALRDPSIRRKTEDYLYSVADVNSGANRDVAEWVTQNSRPDQPVFVWGFEPEIYDLARRKPASRYVYNVPQRVEWALDSRDRLMADLEATPPAIIVVERRDVFPAVTGNGLDSNDSLTSFPRMASYLRERYRLATRIEDFDLYLPR